MDEATLKALRAMSDYGGGFASALAAAWRRADSENAARLEAAFPELLSRYYGMAIDAEKRRAFAKADEPC